MGTGSKNFQELKNDIQLQAKKGVDFILAASILWLVISFIWTLEYTAYNRSILTFMVGAALLPLAFGLSKILRTKWKVKDNPLQPLGLWLNFAQLIYFPILIFILLTNPDFFILAYAVITGAHLFPYAWLYDEIGYAVVAIVISLGTLLIALNVEPERVWTIPLFTSVLLLLLASWMLLQKQNQQL